MTIFAHFFKRKKKLPPLKYEISPDKARKLISDEKGRKDEQRAFCIVETQLRVLIREKAEKGKLGLKGLTNIEFYTDMYDNEERLREHRGEPGKDIWFKLLYPEELRQERIDIEVKSSEAGQKEHKKRYSTPVVIVNPKISDEKIAQRMFNIIFEFIRAKLKEKNGPCF